MAVKVLKHGSDFLKATCPKCGCLFQFKVEDMHFYGNQIEQYESISCPDCGKEITWWFGEKSGIHKTNFHPYN